MSKQFKTQDYKRYKRLGKRWRRPVGWQSKLRLKRNSAGRKAGIGYGTRKEGELDEIVTVRNASDVAMAGGRPIMIASAVGAKSVLEIVKKAKEMDSRIVNAKKAKRAAKIHKQIADRKKEKKKKEEEKKKAEEKAKEKGKEKKKEQKKDEEKEQKKEEEKKEHKVEEKIKEEVKGTGAQVAASQDEDVVGNVP